MVADCRRAKEHHSGKGKAGQLLGPQDRGAQELSSNNLSAENDRNKGLGKIYDCHKQPDNGSLNFFVDLIH